MISSRSVSTRLCVLTLLLLLSFPMWGAVKHTPLYYEQITRQYFRNLDWESGKKTLDEGIKQFPDESNLNELMGQYYFQKKDMKLARFFLVKSIQASSANNRARRLLVKVERETKNYSSAICYINELLEGSPYERSLWMDKMDLYTKQGNEVEADRLMHRLIQLFPEDKEIARMVHGRMEETYLKARNDKDRNKLEEQLIQMIASYPNNPDYYLWMINLLHAGGRYEEALAYAEKGIAQIPNHVVMIQKKIGILQELHRYVQAKDFLSSHLRAYPGSPLRSLMPGIEKEIAYDALNYDAYIQFGKVYEKSKDVEALQFLLNTSMSRGYYDDALYYIQEKKKSRGQDDPELLYREYTVLKRMGEQQRAQGVLERLFVLQPQNLDVLDELNAYHLRQAAQAISVGDYQEAIPHLDFVLQNNQEGEARLSAVKRKYTCLMEMKNYSEAALMLDAMYHTGLSERDYSLLYSDYLSRSGHREEALKMLADLIRRTPDTMPERASYINQYEEIAVPYIKQLILSGATPRAYEQSKEYLTFCPDSREGLLYAMSTAKTLGMEAEYEAYAKIAIQKYPNDVNVLSRWAGIENDAGLYAHTLHVLRERLKETPGDSTLIRLHSSTTDLMAASLVKEKMAVEALVELDSALVFDPSNRMLLYGKGLAFESLRMYDSAHYYMRYYEPSLMEVSEFKHRLHTLRNKGLKNDLFVEYLHSRYGDNETIRGLATIGYTHRMKRNSFTLTLNYAGRDGAADHGSEDSEESGGVGLQQLFSWTHQTRRKWSWTLGGGYSYKYFPRYQGYASVDIELPRDWTMDIRGTYRNIRTGRMAYYYDEEENAWLFDHWIKSRSHLFGLGVGATHQFEMFSLGGHVDAMYMRKKVYGYASAQGRYYPLSDRTSYISATVGVGTAPEASILNYALPGSFSHINSMVGLGAIWLFNPHLSMGVEGTWHTFYNQSEIRLGNEIEYTDQTKMKYKNLFNIHAILKVSF